MFTMERKDGTSVTFTFIIAEEEDNPKKLGMQGMCATEEEAISLINDCAAKWKTRGWLKGRFLHRDDKVTPFPGL